MTGTQIGLEYKAVNIPEGDLSQIKSKINAYYARMRSEFDDEGIVSPFEQDSKALEDETVPVFGEWFTGQISTQCASMLQGALWGGLVDEVELNGLTTLCEQHINAIRAEMPQNISLRPMVAAYMLMGADGAGEAKAGRVLNERNYLKIKQAGELLADVLSSAGLTDDSSAEKRTDGPSVSTDAPTPSEGAGPQDDETPAANREELLRQRLANLEAK